jgi:NTE family protein
VNLKPEEQEDETQIQREPEAGIGICLSGGGYRAMLYHVGALWRLNEVGLLTKAARISSVSGGSITAAWLARVWAEQKWPKDSIIPEEDFRITFAGFSWRGDR